MSSELRLKWVRLNRGPTLAFGRLSEDFLDRLFCLDGFPKLPSQETSALRLNRFWQIMKFQRGNLNFGKSCFQVISDSELQHGSSAHELPEALLHLAGENNFPRMAKVRDPICDFPPAFGIRFVRDHRSDVSDGCEEINDE